MMVVECYKRFNMVVECYKRFNLPLLDVNFVFKWDGQNSIQEIVSWSRVMSSRHKNIMLAKGLLGCNNYWHLKSKQQNKYQFLQK